MKGLSQLIILAGLKLILQGCAATDYFNYYSCEGHEILGMEKKPFRISINDNKVKVQSSGFEKIFLLDKYLAGYATLEKIDASKLVIDYGASSRLPNGFIDLETCEMYPFGR